MRMKRPVLAAVALGALVAACAFTPTEERCIRLEEEVQIHHKHGVDYLVEVGHEDYFACLDAGHGHAMARVPRR